MMTNLKIFQLALLAAGVVATAAIVAFGVKADRLARIGAGYKAKIACSEIFLAQREVETVISSEFAGIAAMMEKIAVHVDTAKKTVRAAGPFGFGRAQAIYREGYGCTLANAGRVLSLPAPAAPGVNGMWEEAPPTSGSALHHVDYGALDFALNTAFETNDANHRSVVVIVDGKIVDERYADGFSKETPFLSWSAAKSVTATLVGAAALRGHINIDDPAPVSEWQTNANLAGITWNDLLRMQSGLAFKEDYANPRSDVNRMLFEAADSGAVAAKKSADHPPGEVWYYSSGTTNLISRTLRQVLSETGVDYHQFARGALFEPIGATSITMEPDASGTFIGSSFVYATARDWARLGQLYLQDGLWGGERLLPEGWGAYVAAPTEASDGQYGAHFWLNYDGANERKRFIPGLPENVYCMAGHEGQYVFIVPSKRMIIVRTGMTRGRSPMPVVAPLIKQIYDAVGEAPIQLNQ